MKANEIMEELHSYGYDKYYEDLIIALYKEINEKLEIIDIICDNYQLKRTILNWCEQNERTPYKQQTFKIKRFFGGKYANRNQKVSNSD